MMLFPAVAALIDSNAVVAGTAVDDGIDGLFMLDRHIRISGEIFRSEVAEDVGNSAHDHTSNSGAAGHRLTRAGGHSGPWLPCRGEYGSFSSVHRYRKLPGRDLPGGADHRSRRSPGRNSCGRGVPMRGFF